jgi:hypothetical protein
VSTAHDGDHQALTLRESYLRGGAACFDRVGFKQNGAVVRAVRSLF